MIKNTPKFEYICCPLHKYTFSITPIRLWVEKECEGKVLNLFSGKTKLNIDEIRNDIDESMPADFHLDALDAIQLMKTRKYKFNTIILDPPYSYRKSMEKYNGKIMSPFRQLKDLIPDILKPFGKVITFGYHSNVMGKNRGFIIEKICLFSHGGAIHDTIASVERKIK